MDEMSVDSRALAQVFRAGPWLMKLGTGLSPRSPRFHLTPVHTRCGERSDTKRGFIPSTSALPCQQHSTNAPTHISLICHRLYTILANDMARYMMNKNAVPIVRHNYVYIRSIAYYMFRLLWNTINRQSEIKEVRTKKYGKTYIVYHTSPALFKIKIEG